jgi:hypothetical protein
VVAATLCGCAENGSLVSTSYDSKTNQVRRVVHTKYFDGADWVIKDKLGVSVVVDNDRQIDDSFAEGKFVVYLWNLSPTNYKLKSLSLKLNGNEVKKISDVVVDPGPNIRTRVNIATERIFVFATSLATEVIVELDGQTIQKKITAVRRTEEEIKRYWGTPNSFPPYPWFPKTATSATAADANKTAQ